MPIFLIVISNIFYHLSTKSTPSNVHPFAVLTVTYGVGMIISAILYLIISKGGNFIEEIHKINYTSFILGFAIVGLEAGNIWMYKVGWNISVGQLICSFLLSICLILIGYFIYHENLTTQKLIGILICMFGLFLINN